jgi:hypothetical protein
MRRENLGVVRLDGLFVTQGAALIVTAPFNVILSLPCAFGLDKSREKKSMANLAAVVQQLKKERDQAAQTVQRLDTALAALAGVATRRGTRKSENRGCPESTVGKGAGE